MLMEKLTKRFGKLKREDIVVAYIPEFLTDNRKRVIKRVIAVEGDHLEIAGGGVYVNNKRVVEDYVHGDATYSVQKYSDYTVPKGHVFIMGDNRDKSSDSREFGPVKLERIEGKVILRLFPFNRFGTP